jgi:hypothetical protein
VHSGPPWSRPALPLMRGVRPNSPVITGTIFPDSPRYSRSSGSAATARSNGGHACRSCGTMSLRMSQPGDEFA